jgi:hypothetical protein
MFELHCHPALKPIIIGFPIVIFLIGLCSSSCSSTDDHVFRVLKSGEVVYLLPLSEDQLRVRTLREHEGSVRLGLEVSLRFDEIEYEVQLRDEDGTLMSKRSITAGDCEPQNGLKLQLHSSDLPGGGYHIAIVGRDRSSGRTSSVRMFPFMLEK